MTDRTWQDLAGCAGVDPDVFFPERRASILPAQRICAECPVWRTCLVVSTSGLTIRRASDEGVWGGIGGSGRRALIRALPECRHDPEESCGDPACSWCSLIDQHRIRLDVAAGRRPRSDLQRIVSFGPGATHGRRVTHAKGCRCAPCSFAASTAGQRLLAAGFDPVGWWEWQFSPYGEETTTAEWTELEEARRVRVLSRAKAAAGAFLATYAEEAC